MLKKKYKDESKIIKKELCIFYNQKKCNNCGLCEEIEKPNFKKKFEEGKIKKPLMKSQTEYNKEVII